MVILICNVTFGFSQNVAINTTGAVGNSSAILDIDATNKGVLLPRVSTAQRTVAASPGGLLNGLGQLPQPAEGLIVYDTDLNLYFYNISITIIPNWISFVPSNTPSPCRISTVKGISSDDSFDMLDTTWYTMDQMIAPITSQNGNIEVQFQSLIFPQGGGSGVCTGPACASDLVFAVSVDNVIQPNTIRAYLYPFFSSMDVFYDINFTVPVTVSVGVTHTIEIKWALNKSVGTACCPYAYNSAQLGQFMSHGETGFGYTSEDWSLPMGYRLMTIYDCPDN